MSVSELLNIQSHESMITTKSEGRADSIVRGSSFSEILKEQKKCPYNHLAKDGLIDYNGVIFVCDYKTNSICLGDMSNPKDVLNICLPSGGHLKVNVNNFGDLSKAAGMFSPADLNAIMRAIAQYNHCTSKLNELDEEELETVEKVSEHTDKQEDNKVDEDEEQYADSKFPEVVFFMTNKAVENRLVAERSR